MLNRRYLLTALAVAVVISGGSIAFGMDKKPFEPKIFEAAQAAGKSILIDVSASWCPTCKIQAVVLSRLGNDPKFKQFVSFNIDYDSQKDLLRKFNVQRQSTLIVFKGKFETGRSTGETNPGSIEALLAKAI
jgi:thiol-disulfide isomerase/thioredoxin